MDPRETEQETYRERIRRKEREATIDSDRHFYADLGATLDRIAGRVQANVAEEAEAKQALRWCRENGNPHRAILQENPDA